MMYVASIAMLIGSVYCVEKLVNNAMFKSDNDNEATEVILNNSDTDLDDKNNIPVVSTDIVIGRPYTNASIKIVKNYYDYQAEATNQEESIIYYGNTYMQNSGVDYASENVFDVISILDGTVISVEENDILGTTVEVRHSNDLISVYQSLSEVSVKKDDQIIQGQILAKSGTSNIGKDLGNHLHFELYYKGEIVNPEEYYNKSVDDL